MRARPVTHKKRPGERSRSAGPPAFLALNRERGAALVLALWGVMAMALIVACVRILGNREATLAEARVEQVQLGGIADAMINTAILRLLDIAQGGHPPTDGTEFPERFAGLTGKLTVQDENGRIDLNQVQRPLLVNFLTANGIDFDTAQALADKILDWREPGPFRRLNGAKADDYRRANIPYAPRGARLQSLDELRLVMGMTPALFTSLAADLTVVSQNGFPDQETAPPGVLRALPGMDSQKIAALLAARAARLVATPDGSLADSAPPPALGHAFAIDARVSGRTTTVQRHALLRLTGIPSAPLVVYQWR